MKRGIIMDKGTVIFDGDIDEAIEIYGSMFQKRKKVVKQDD